MSEPIKRFFPISSIGHWIKVNLSSFLLAKYSIIYNNKNPLFIVIYHLINQNPLSLDVLLKYESFT